MMMNKHIKNLSKDAMHIGVAGIGLSLGAGIAGSAGSTGAVTALGTMGKGLGTIGSISVMSHTLGFLQDSLPKKKKWK